MYMYTFANGVQSAFKLKMRRNFLKPAALLCCLVLLAVTQGLETSEQDQINTSLDAATKTLDAFSKFGNTATDVAEKAKNFLSKIPFEKLASCLGAFGGFISVLLIFIPKGDSAELKYMKNQFAKVDQKLDLIASKIDDVQSLIKLQTQKTQYIKEEHNILHGYRQLNAYMDEILKTNCSTKEDCLRKRLSIGIRFKESLNIKRSLFTILDGTYETTVFGEPLFLLIVSHYKGDVGKLDRFANNILKLSVKGQQVILAYEKLTGSKFSVMSSMLEWLKSIYRVRSEKNKYEQAVYTSIKKYVGDDVNNQKYQVHMSSNLKAATTMRSDLRKKYAWLDWIVISYKQEKDWQHAYEATSGSFVNMPADTNKRKRVIIAVAQGKGTYDYQRNEFEKQLNVIRQRLIIESTDTGNVKNLFPSLKANLIKRGVWKITRTLLVLKYMHDRDVKVARDDTHSSRYYDEEIEIRVCYYTSREGTSKTASREITCRSERVHVIAVFKTKEEINANGCTKSCTGNNGKCMTKPYSATLYCVCKPYYQGSNCESKIKTDVAENIEKMFATATKIPDMVDVFYGIKNMGDKLGASLGNIQGAIVSLDKAMQASFEKIGKQLDQHFKWANLISIYSRPMELLKHTVKRFAELPKGHAESKRLAEETLKPHHISYWISKINTLIEGRNDEVHRHKPIIHMVMDKYRYLACSEKYKNTVRNVWRQINIQQLQGYMAWIQALTVMNRPSELVMKQYQAIVASQKSIMASKTCNISIDNSVNGDCNSKFALYPGMTIDLKCKPNHYVSGSKTPSCEKTAQCLPCECNAEGSTSQQCDDNANCKCKHKFYGPKCGHRHCEWSTWHSWSSCSKHCGYGGIQSRVRHIHITHRGNGNHCHGIAQQSRACFNKCCWGHFHCSRRRWCLLDKYRCDYTNTCGDSEDEEGCSESCYNRYTGYAYHGYHDVYYYSNFHVNCPYNELMRGFQIERQPGNNNNARYRMNCCGINPNGRAPGRPWICRIKHFSTGYSAYGWGRAHYLDAQNVNCGGTSLMMGYHFVRHFGWPHQAIRFDLKCCEVVTPWVTRMHCYDTVNVWTDDGGGQLIYLLYQNIQCKDRYFVSSFRLQRTGHWGKQWRYIYRCCKINA